jgi:hypothetical protein
MGLSGSSFYRVDQQGFDAQMILDAQLFWTSKKDGHK